MHPNLLKKGLFQILKLDELTTDITAAEIKLWIESWKACRAPFAFGIQSKHIKISYLKSNVLLEILLVVDYTKYKTEELLEAILEFLQKRLHLIKH